MALVATFFVVLGWLYISTGRLPGGAPRLEFRLATEARDALADQGQDDWAYVDMDGRTAILSGVAPNEAALAIALEAVKGSVWGGGVARVVNETDLRMVAAPYTFEARLEGERLTLKGYAPDRAARDAIGARAAQAFAGNVDASGVEIASGAPDGSDWLGAVDFAVAQLVRLREGVLTIEDAQMRIVGAANSHQVGAEVARQLRQAPSPFEGRAEIESPEPTTPEEAGEALEDAAPEGGSAAVALPARPATVPSTLSGATGSEACQSEIDGLLTADSFRFRFNNAAVSAASGPLLDSIAEVARRCGRVGLTIAGHTDTSGDPNFNIYLSEQRARAVRDELIGRGVDPASLTAHGFGDAQPMADNATAAGRALNRRIEIDVIERTEPGP
jgi:outer membrane protein OmpA-like peptidoglycan-associated protein